MTTIQAILTELNIRKSFGNSLTCFLYRIVLNLVEYLEN